MLKTETPDDRHVFLEMNPAGEWGMLERELSLPISEAIAESVMHLKVSAQIST